MLRHYLSRKPWIGEKDFFFFVQIPHNNSIVIILLCDLSLLNVETTSNPFNAKPIFDKKKKKKELGNFIATLVFMVA